MKLFHHIKSGAGAASLRGLQAEMAAAIPFILDVFRHHGYSARLSCGTDGKHTAGSSHYRGHALDFSKRGIHPGDHNKITRNLRIALGDDFQVIEEHTHWHVQFKPQEPLNHG